MFIGLAFAICACFVWGLIFVIPGYLCDFSAIEVVLGRYLSYGILSALLFFRTGFTRVRRYTPKAWTLAFIFALVSNLIYYLGIVAGLRFASPTLTVLIIGMAPIMIALYGNWQTREIAYRDLVIPCLLITFGLVLVNAIEVDWSFKATSLTQYLLGLGGIGAALTAWSWFAVQNARFLKKNPQILASEWSTVIGVATLFWALLFGTIFALCLRDDVNLPKFFSLTPATLRYLGGVSVLGFVCSWLGCFLWSRASVFLPISLMGPLLIFETIFGLFFVYIFERSLPSWIELAGVSAMMGGILMSVYTFRKKQTINS